MSKTILITGATDGIGLALAHHYRARQQRLILVGRRPFGEVPLDQFKADDYCRVDLSRPDSAARVAAWLIARNIRRLDLLIHNAGLGFVGPTAEQPPENIRTLVDVNLWAPIVLTHELLPWLKKARGKVVFISSVMSALPCPRYTVYGATKAALDGFARSLRIELAPAVQVQLIHPGATRTGMHRKSGATGTGWQNYPSPESVAGRIAGAIDRPRREAAIGWNNVLLRLGGLYLPGLIDWVMRRKQQ